MTAGGLNGYSGGNFKVPRVRQLDSPGATHILSTIIRCIWRAFNEIVPEKNVLFGWMGCDIWRWGLLNSLIFLGKLSLSALKEDVTYPFVTCFGGHAERRWVEELPQATLYFLPFGLSFVGVCETCFHWHWCHD